MSSLVTNNPGLVIQGLQSWLFTFSAGAFSADFNLGGYYSAVDASPFTNISPGTYQITAQVRVLDPGYDFNFRFFYDSFYPLFVPTNSIVRTSGTYSSADGLVTWTSTPFTIVAPNPNHYWGVQFQVQTGPSPLSDVRFVVDSIDVIPEPNTLGVLLLGAAFLALRRFHMQYKCC